MLVLLEKLSKWLAIAGLLALVAGWWNRDRLPDPDFYSNAVGFEPRQSKTREGEFNARAGDQRYRIKPLFEYELDGVVVSMNHAGNWIDIYHEEWADYLNLKDICVIWGENVESAVYHEMEFSNTTWTCWTSWPNREVGQRFQDHQLSNNHLLSDDPEVQAQILAARPGDQIRLRGYLAEYRNPANGFERGSSTTRTDSGNGACETVYVERFDILREANPGWRGLFTLGTWLAPLALVAWVALLMMAPVRRGIR